MIRKAFIAFSATHQAASMIAEQKKEEEGEIRTYRHRRSTPARRGTEQSTQFLKKQTKYFGQNDKYSDTGPICRHIETRFVCCAN